MRVLYVPTEGPDWPFARSLTYSAYLAFEEGLRANGVDCYTVPAIWSRVPLETGAWLNKLEQLCDGKVFDQIWVEAITNQLDERLLELFSGLAPVRLAILQESLTYTDREIFENNGWELREELAEARLRYFTHAAVVDEYDAKKLNSRGVIQALWSPESVPERFIRRAPDSPVRNRGIFIGNPYGDRSRWLNDPILKGKLEHVVSRENFTSYPAMFNRLSRAANAYSRTTLPARPGLWAYLQGLRWIRERCNKYYFETLRSARATVNLMHPVKGYSIRVVEAMAAGTPVISWKIPNRPMNEALFEDGNEILLFAEDSPQQLSDRLDQVMEDPAFAARISTKAQEKIRRLHTTKIRMAQILRWIATNEQPDYYLALARPGSSELPSAGGG